MLALFAIAILIKSAKVQLVDGKRWSAAAERQQMSAQKVPAPRGEILDATKRVIAQSREMVRLEIAPREVRDRVLNHVQGDVGSKHYNLHEFVAEKRAALMRFEGMLMAILAGESAAVVPFVPRGAAS
jgi:cell division protein FtsI/penicillin-binding protein 2